MGPDKGSECPFGHLNSCPVTPRTKRILGSFLVLVLCLGGIGAYVLRGRGADSVAIGEDALTAANPAPPVAEAEDPATATPSAAATAKAKAKAAKVAVKAKAVAKAKAAKAKAAEAAKVAAVKARPKAAATIPAKAGSSVKKGASIFGKPAGITSALADSGVSWTYNWSAGPNGVSAPKGVEFVPMIWGAGSADTGTLAQAKQNGSTLLGFNEPDFKDQSNMTVDAALDLWPKLEATRMRLGSPAVAWGADQDGQWLDRFMAGAKTRGYRVDFITLHWYGGDFNTTNATNQLRAYVQATYAKYHKPIWITEYALMNFSSSPRTPSAQVQADFVKKSTAMLEGLSYVERYAWFAFPTSDDGTDGTGLYRPGGIPTLPGKAYRAAGK
jgi:hypothetical protein